METFYDVLSDIYTIILDHIPQDVLMSIVGSIIGYLIRRFLPILFGDFSTEHSSPSNRSPSPPIVESSDEHQELTQNTPSFTHHNTSLKNNPRQSNTNYQHSSSVRSDVDNRLFGGGHTRDDERKHERERYDNKGYDNEGYDNTDMYDVANVHNRFQHDRKSVDGEGGDKQPKSDGDKSQYMFGEQYISGERYTLGDSKDDHDVRFDSTSADIPFVYRVLKDSIQNGGVLKHLIDYIIMLRNQHDRCCRELQYWQRQYAELSSRYQDLVRTIDP